MARVLLLSTYEQGHQPLGLAAPASALRAAGHSVECRDLAVEGITPDAVRDAGLIGISAPMHTASRLGLRLAEQIRLVAPAAHLAWYGLYASSLAELLSERGLADSVLGAEYEPALVRVADALDAAAGGGFQGISVSEHSRQRFGVPDRRALPALDRYARVLREDGAHLAGYAEATRGCAHTCLHCPVTVAYGGRLRLVQREVVLADIAQQVEAGARHITFGDPDFLNAPSHSLGVVQALHAAHPEVTFDITVKVEHLLEHASLLPALRAQGALFVTSAFESTSATVLAHLQKGHVAADLERALAHAEAAGLPLRPTWVAFTPWTSLADYLEMLTFIEEYGLVRHVQPVQYALRLLLPPGSPLAGVLAEAGELGPLDGERLTYGWRHPDPKMDALQVSLAALVEESASRHSHDEAGAADVLKVFARVKHAARAAARDVEASALAAEAVLPQPKRFVPGLAESWFC
jgi:radical SAM superfamily enzyme YgiQ (UPF0313 family)